MKSPSTNASTIFDLFESRRKNRTALIESIRSDHAEEYARGIESFSQFVFENLPKVDKTEPYQDLGKYFVKIMAPMVRYSKLPFRLTVKKFGCDIVYTHMMISESFTRSQQARDSDFSTCSLDFPLVAQFASKTAIDFARSAWILRDQVDAVEINCGCPQRWAMQEGYGSAMLKEPEKIADFINQTNRLFEKNNNSNEEEGKKMNVAVKIRIDKKDLRKTVDLIRQVHKAGAAWVTIHGRTPAEKSSVDVDWKSIRTIVQACRDSFASDSSRYFPFVHNGDVFSLESATRFALASDLDGVMSARGLLQNPALFGGFDSVPRECVQFFVDASLKLGSASASANFAAFQNHILFMMGPAMMREDRLAFTKQQSTSGIIDFLSRFKIL